MEASSAIPVDAPICGKTGEHTTIAEWLCRIRAEYTEVPGLSLTRQQAKRLWGLDDVTCDILLETLIESRFLHRTVFATYVRSD